jgi:hypothetical protein
MASGWGGPLYALLQISELVARPDVEARLRATVDFFVSMLGSDGDFFSVKPHRVQWCHGSPGVIPLFGLASQVLGDASYLKAAQQAARYTVEHGVIEKGLQLLHGVSGNTYLVLDLFRRTQDPQWLYFAYQMQILALDTPALVDLNGKAVTYDCKIGSSLYSTYGAIPCWSDLLTHLEDPSKVTAPYFGMHW